MNDFRGLQVADLNPVPQAEDKKSSVRVQRHAGPSGRIDFLTRGVWSPCTVLYNRTFPVALIEINRCRIGW